MACYKKNPRVSFDATKTTRLPSKGSRTKVTGCAKLCPASKKKLSIPALSIPPKQPPLDPVLEKLKNKTMYRNAPKGENLKKIKAIIESVNMEVVTVQEFVGLVSPHTGDNGNVLRTVMGDDLSSFRRMAKRVYDTMTQDVSDVLANEQIHLTDHYNERYTLFMDKMMRTIDEIYRYVPNFDFERYYTDPEYLNMLYPIVATDNLDPEEREMHRRQEAYHRLQWLRSEGTRLNEENSKLQARLRELKAQQKEDLIAAKAQEEVAELRKSKLEAAEADLQCQLQDLNTSMEKTLIQTEEELRLTGDAKLTKKAAAKQARKLATKPSKPKEKWNVKAAKAVEESVVKATVESALSSVSVSSTVSSKTGAVKKRGRPKIKKAKRDSYDFDFSPCRSPPKSKPRDPSPFHYSPPKSPPLERPITPRTTRVERTTTYSEPVGGARGKQTSTTSKGPCNPCRKGAAPKDTWGGFG